MMMRTVLSVTVIKNIYLMNEDVNSNKSWEYMYHCSAAQDQGSWLERTDLVPPGRCYCSTELVAGSMKLIAGRTRLTEGRMGLIVGKITLVRYYRREPTGSQYCNMEPVPGQRGAVPQSLYRGAVPQGEQAVAPGAVMVRCILVNAMFS